MLTDLCFRFWAHTFRLNLGPAGAEISSGHEADDVTVDKDPGLQQFNSDFYRLALKFDKPDVSNFRGCSHVTVLIWGDRLFYNVAPGSSSSNSTKVLDPAASKSESSNRTTGKFVLILEYHQRYGYRPAYLTSIRRWGRD